MTDFIRVRGKTIGDPLHEFDVPAQAVERHPDRYKVVDKKPVPHQRPASFIPGTLGNPAKKRDIKPGEDSTAPVGANSKE